MSLKINYSKKTEANASKNIVFFVDEKFNTNKVGKNLSSKEIYFINDLLKSADLKKKILTFGMSSNKNVILIWMETIKSLIKSHKMIPHPEGGYYVEVYKNKNVSHIYYLLEKGQYSHWHRIKKNETIHFYSGSPLRIYTSKNGQEYQINEIGSENRFIYSVESNIWFSLKSTGLFSLIGCTVAPAFEFEDLEIAPKNWKPSKFKGYL